MELMIALAAEDVSARISDGVRSILKRSYATLFANVFVKVYDVEDRKKSEFKVVRNMDPNYSPVVVAVEDQNHSRVVFVFATHGAEYVHSAMSTTTGYVVYGDKTEEFQLESRIVKVRGLEYAIATAIARRAPNFLNFGAT